MADRGGLLTRASAALGKLFLKRELVGVDALGNKYYKYELVAASVLGFYFVKTLLCLEASSVRSSKFEALVTCIMDEQ